MCNAWFPRAISNCVTCDSVVVVIFLKTMYNRQLLYLVDFRSTALCNMNRKPLGLLWLFQPSTADITIRKTTTSITFKHVANKLEQNWATVYKEYRQNEDQKKPAEKKPSREKNSAGKPGNLVAHVLKSQSYEDYTVRRSLPTCTEHVIPTKHGKFVIIIRKQRKITKTSQIPSRNSICHLINQLYKKYINK